MTVTTFESDLAIRSVAAPETGDLLAIEGEVHEAMSEDLDHDLLVGVEDEGAVEQHVG